MARSGWASRGRDVGFPPTCTEYLLVESDLNPWFVLLYFVGGTALGALYILWEASRDEKETEQYLEEANKRKQHPERA